ncbi:MAG TPA: vitamin B12 dependent-methionine synthase activation domain-containing protein [Clostridia bacterium]|nr:vitamin B12 dependent-methionine synthase activation domain-containing protein [Clostridia bacterium]HPQ46195.1 vitamin B12 dependent-methionine synthase activation domain-containing protein [Clostridia bacterium]HRX43104.1 vitamin B12 dependent-methionine synthase activation domain-containing protein [Clostridia bacterium]
MKINLIENIELKYNVEAMKNKLRIDEPEDVELFDSMIEKAMSIGNAKLAFGEAYITERFDDGVSIDSYRFHCRLMKNNLMEVNRVFPFVATCGRELYEWARGIDDVFIQYWADHIMEVTLRNAIAHLYDTVRTAYGVSKIASMNPGSLDGWPIEQQVELFELLENKNRDLGVELTESFLMVPQKSVSGILFKSKSGYTNCKLCEMVNCPSRRAPFEPGLREKLMEE